MKFSRTVFPDAHPSSLLLPVVGDVLLPVLMAKDTAGSTIPRFMSHEMVSLWGVAMHLRAILRAIFTSPPPRPLVSQTIHTEGQRRRAGSLSAHRDEIAQAGAISLSSRLPMIHHIHGTCWGKPTMNRNVGRGLTAVRRIGTSSGPLRRVLQRRFGG